MNIDPRVSDLLLQWEELCEQGRSVPLEQLCCDCPHLLDELRRQVQALRAMNPLLQTPFTSPHDKETPRPGEPTDSVPPDQESASHSRQAGSLPAVAGYEIVRELGRGGMGVVYLARQLKLNRLVALKMILAAVCGSDQQRRRFRAEAEIIARLRHPNIVDIYEVSEVAGRAFCVLELIDGGNLAEALASQPCPPRIAAELLATLADAVHAAHACGVIHRDLKPANILLSFSRDAKSSERSADAIALRSEDFASRLNQGVPKLTDFGLAKQLDSDHSLTVTGMVMGTPSYMAPEQAQGRHNELGPTADIYSLGAILYEALTGRPPLLGTTTLETLQLVIGHEPLPPRRIQPRLPRDLDTVCMKCLEKDPARRFASAAELAADLRRFLAGEAVHARPTPAWERTFKWVRRRPTAAAGLAFGFLTALVLLLAGVTSHAAAQRHHDRVQSEVDQASDWLDRARVTPGKEATLLATQAREAAQRASALVESRRVDSALLSRLSAVLARLDDEKKDRRLLETLDAASMAQSRRWPGMHGFDLTTALPLFRKALADYGLTPGEKTPQEVATRIVQRPAVVREALLASLDEWVALAEAIHLKIDEPHSDWLRAVLAAAEPEETWGWKVRQLAARGTPTQQRKALEKLATQVDVEHLPARAVMMLARRLQVRGAWQAVVALLRRAQPFHSGDFWINEELATALHTQEPADLTEALRYYMAAVAARPDNAGARSNLGTALYSLGKFEQAVVELRRAVQLDPGEASSHANLGAALLLVNKLEEAAAAVRRAIDIEPKTAWSHSNLGYILLRQGKREEAIASLRQSINLDCGFAPAHQNLGQALTEEGKTEEAITEFNKALAIDPRSVDTLMNLATAKISQDKTREAIALLRKVVEINPKHAVAHVKLGLLLALQGKFTEAVSSSKKGIDLDAKLVEFHVILGVNLQREGKKDLAMTVIRQAIAVDPNYARGHYALAGLLLDRGDFDEAIAEYNKSLVLDPKDMYTYRQIGIVQKKRGHLDEAVAAFRKGIAIAPKSAELYVELGITHYLQGKANQAEAAFRQAIAIDPKFAPAYFQLGGLLFERGKFDEAIACNRRTIALDPKHIDAHINLGAILCDKKHDYEGAVTVMRRALKLLGPKHPLAAVMTQQISRCDRFLALQPKLPEILAGTHQPDSASECVEYAQLCSQAKLHAGAARLFADAFQSEPRLAGAFRQGYRYNAACSAVLAAAGQAEDARLLPDKLVQKLRRQAYRWLQAELMLYAKLAERHDFKMKELIRERLINCQQDPDLASVRGNSALARLDADERQQWEGLWHEVDALVRKVAPKK